MSLYQYHANRCHCQTCTWHTRLSSWQYSRVQVSGWHYADTAVVWLLRSIRWTRHHWNKAAPPSCSIKLWWETPGSVVLRHTQLQDAVDVRILNCGTRLHIYITQKGTWSSASYIFAFTKACSNPNFTQNVMLSNRNWPEIRAERSSVTCNSCGQM